MFVIFANGCQTMNNSITAISALVVLKVKKKKQNIVIYFKYAMKNHLLQKLMNVQNVKIKCFLLDKDVIFIVMNVEHVFQAHKIKVFTVNNVKFVIMEKKRITITVKIVTNVR